RNIRRYYRAAPGQPASAPGPLENSPAPRRNRRFEIGEPRLGCNRGPALAPSWNTPPHRVPHPRSSKAAASSSTSRRDHRRKGRKNEGEATGLSCDLSQRPFGLVCLTTLDHTPCTGDGLPKMRLSCSDSRVGETWLSANGIMMKDLPLPS